MARGEFAEVLKAFESDPSLAGMTWEKIVDHFPDPHVFTPIVKLRDWKEISYRKPRGFPSLADRLYLSRWDNADARRQPAAEQILTVIESLDEKGAEQHTAERSDKPEGWIESARNAYFLSPSNSDKERDPCIFCNICNALKLDSHTGRWGTPDDEKSAFFRASAGQQHFRAERAGPSKHR